MYFNPLMDVLMSAKTAIITYVFVLVQVILKSVDGIFNLKINKL